MLLAWKKPCYAHPVSYTECMRAVAIRQHQILTYLDPQLTAKNVERSSWSRTPLKISYKVCMRKNNYNSSSSGMLAFVNDHEFGESYKINTIIHVYACIECAKGIVDDLERSR